MQFPWRLPIAIVVTALSAFQVHAQTCRPPPSFVEKPQPALAPPAQLAAHTEESTVDRPFSIVMAANGKSSLKNTIQKVNTLPGVAGEYALNLVPPGTVGFHHLVCLTDGSTLQEYILVNERTATTYRFKYVVWNYTSEQARPIEYATGEFNDTQIDANHTHIVWTYSFKLKDNAFPGYLGPLGRYLFHRGFLDTKYASMMRATLAASKARIEQEPG